MACSNTDNFTISHQIITEQSALCRDDSINNRIEEDERSTRRARYLVNRGDCFRAVERASDASLVSTFSLHCMYGREELYGNVK